MMHDDLFDHPHASEGSKQTSVPLVREIALRPGQEAAPGKGEPGEFTRLFQSAKPLQPAAAPAQRAALDISQLLRSLDLGTPSAPMPPAAPAAAADRSAGASGSFPELFQAGFQPQVAPSEACPPEQGAPSITQMLASLAQPAQRRAEHSPLPSAPISNAEPGPRETGPEAGLPGFPAGGESEATRIFAAPQPAIPAAGEAPSRPQPAIAGALDRYLPLLVLLNAGLLMILGALLIFFLLRRH